MINRRSQLVGGRNMKRNAQPQGDCEGKFKRESVASNFPFSVADENKSPDTCEAQANIACIKCATCNESSLVRSKALTPTNEVFSDHEWVSSENTAVPDTPLSPKNLRMSLVSKSGVSVDGK
jgi:hypothetical protein